MQLRASTPTTPYPTPPCPAPPLTQGGAQRGVAGGLTCRICGPDAETNNKSPSFLPPPFNCPLHLLPPPRPMMLKSVAG
ncbi:hypothetical protein Pcinc_034553 [Petrolisthes cinctipes]|uniref:Uncharacterized protein n=1 Tax=Petrolisthes cinctipes TaxID=88211 RepID=A0AAE1C048_PETCI|nr:hypothetical protein Pcinc_034553 [Petrolisthes cinctipes]